MMHAPRASDAIWILINVNHSYLRLYRALVGGFTILFTATLKLIT